MLISELLDPDPHSEKGSGHGFRTYADPDPEKNLQQASDSARLEAYYENASFSRYIFQVVPYVFHLAIRVSKEEVVLLRFICHPTCLTSSSGCEKKTLF